MNIEEPSPHSSFFSSCQVVVCERQGCFLIGHRKRRCDNAAKPPSPEGEAVMRSRTLAAIPGCALVAWACLGGPARAQDASVQALIDKMGAVKGICLLVGDAGVHAADLAKHTDLTILVQLADTKQVTKLRTELDAAGLL